MFYCLCYLFRDLFHLSMVSDKVDAVKDKKEKRKVNRYQQFSTAPLLDPIEETIQRVETQKLRKTMEKNAYIRGTTTPLVSLPSSYIGTKRNYTNIDIVSIDPSDPSSFGFDQIGIVSKFIFLKESVNYFLLS